MRSFSTASLSAPSRSNRSRALTSALSADVTDDIAEMGAAIEALVAEKLKRNGPCVSFHPGVKRRRT
eukprot:8495613-Alexandrium_andersonii.AAC.1